MNKDSIKTEIIVKEQRINVLRIDNKEFISLTDLARYANPEEPKIPIYAWMRNKDVIAYLGLWEQLNNENFKGHEFETFENQAGKNSFYMSPQKWIKETNAVGIISKSGNNGGTYARSDIALEFAITLSTSKNKFSSLPCFNTFLNSFLNRLVYCTWYFVFSKLNILSL